MASKTNAILMYKHYMEIGLTPTDPVDVIGLVTSAEAVVGEEEKEIIDHLLYSCYTQRSAFFRNLKVSKGLRKGCLPRGESA